MPYEIERRFLPKEPGWRPEGGGMAITQGYFKLGENAVMQARLWPWLHLRLNDQRLVWLNWRDYRALKQYLQQDGALPAGWKARIRRYGHSRYVFDLKGPRSGTTRFELDDRPLPAPLGAALLQQCGETVLHKTRHTLPYAGHDWQVDVYEGQHAGLVTCEVELPAADTAVDLPPWVGEEITHRKLFG